MAISLSLDMKIIHDLGHDNYQLKCMCGEEFTYLHNHHNWTNVAGKSVAKCPKCKATWTGNVKESDREPEIKLRYFCIMAIFKDAEQAKQCMANSAKILPLSVGTGIDMQHFVLVTMGRFHREMLEAFELLQITEIDKETFTSLGASIQYRSMMSGLTGIMKMILDPDLGESHDQPERENDSDRGES